MVESLVKDAGNRLLTRAARKRARQAGLPLRSVNDAVRFRHSIGFDIRSLTDLCKNSRHRTARVSKRTPFGAATVRERTQRAIFLSNLLYFISPLPARQKALTTNPGFSHTLVGSALFLPPLRGS